MWKAAGEVKWINPVFPSGDTEDFPVAKLKIAICPIRPTTPTTPLQNQGKWDSNILPPLANPTEVNGFVTAKRLEEHLAGRHLLSQMLIKWGVDDLSLVEVKRDENRAPSLSWIEGTFRRQPLPNISIGHSGEWAIVALIDSEWFVGIDAEPSRREISPSAFPMMAKGDELDKLNASPNSAVLRWTVKEAIQKCMRLGMNLNPRDIVTHIESSIGSFEAKFLIGKSIIQLTSWREHGQQISLAIRAYSPPPKSSLDLLLEQTAKEMNNQIVINKDGNKEYTFGVGCSTTRHCQ
nr:4'-phosphopantetheinyl transferase superfamily protein [Euryarchaeota archaeon]